MSHAPESTGSFATIVCTGVIEKDEYGLPKFEHLMELYGKIHQLMQEGVIVSAYALGAKGIAEAVSKMAFGNRLGAELCNERDPKTYFLPEYGSLVAEVAQVFAISTAKETRVGGTLISLKLPDMLSLPPMDGRPKRSCAS